MKVVKEPNPSLFIEHNHETIYDNAQMKLHLYDILENINLKVSRKEIVIDENLDLIFDNINISVEPNFIQFALAYEELEETYRLEAITLIQEVLTRMGNEYYLKDDILSRLFKTITKEQKARDEKLRIKRNIVWLNRAIETDS